MATSRRMVAHVDGAEVELTATEELNPDGGVTLTWDPVPGASSYTVGEEMRDVRPPKLLWHNPAEDRRTYLDEFGMRSFLPREFGPLHTIFRVP